MSLCKAVLKGEKIYGKDHRYCKNPQKTSPERFLAAGSFHPSRRPDVGYLDQWNPHSSRVHQWRDFRPGSGDLLSLPQIIRWIDGISD
jgi:hypothetical protein